MRAFYLLATIVGSVVPWLFFAAYFRSEGADPIDLPAALFPNGAAGGFTADVLISIVVFLVWSFVDARRHAIGLWWLVVPSSVLIGLSSSLPLYLLLRETEMVGRRRHSAGGADRGVGRPVPPRTFDGDGPHL
ncbi:DUF2834 domain-containing protein [Rhodococcus tibetensis]|uniref:DUF2834 domain-containing protein n=1 Tax=Rhodococcus tibetensis TaxID=2965064 RepID=A0ABT1Q9W2_9NOCA|nr:DUF2834 domain-containing protein [Rhodococcus sp. FXJ9.536]MCQ4118483.1 DUF2834 domain-containing protein [Rhodococcus sp. FXJ9.536]